MIKDIFKTIIINEESFKKISNEKKSTLLKIYAITNILFLVLFNCFLFYTENDFSFRMYLLLSLGKIKDNIVCSLLWVLILFFVFRKKISNINIFYLVLKTILALGFIYPIYTVLFYYFEHGIFLLAKRIYDIVFIIKFIKVNDVQDSISTEKISLYVILSFFIHLIFFIGIYKLFLLQ